MVEKIIPFSKNLAATLVLTAEELYGFPRSQLTS